MDSAFLSDISHIILRDLKVVAEEVQATPEDKLWIVLPGVTNSVGTLAFHLCGNLRHFIGAKLANDGFIRDREAEFAKHDLTKSELLSYVHESVLQLEFALGKLSSEMLEDEMPDTPPHHKGRSIRFFLMQLSCHLSRHTGQMNYLRRMLVSI